MTPKKIKYPLLIIGAILLIISAFLPSHGINFSRVSDIPDITFKGINSPAWVITGICTVVLFGTGFFFNSVPVKIIYYFLFAILTAFLVFMIKRMISPFMDSYTTIFFSGFYLVMAAYVLVNAATIISLHRPYVKKEVAGNDLLDSEL